VDSAKDDPLSKFTFSNRGYYDLFTLNKYAVSSAIYNGTPKALPILLISGQDDPVGNGGKGVQAIYQRMKKSGMEDVTLKLFPGARHDLLHEECSGAPEARKLIADWTCL
jgi:alpha-beta hydrolase superfamily lysophospholipase